MLTASSITCTASAAASCTLPPGATMLPVCVMPWAVIFPEAATETSPSP